MPQNSFWIAAPPIGVYKHHPKLPSVVPNESIRGRVANGLSTCRKTATPCPAFTGSLRLCSQDLALRVDFPLCPGLGRQPDRGGERPALTERRRRRAEAKTIARGTSFKPHVNLMI